MTTSWKYWGKLDNGEMVFVSQEGEIAVEKDYRHLVEPKPEELFEIFQKWPGLIDKIVKSKDKFPGINADVIAELKETIKIQERDSVNEKLLISALKYANEEKDKIIVALMEDIENYKVEQDVLRKHIEALYRKGEEKEDQYRAMILPELEWELSAEVKRLKKVIKAQDKKITRREATISRREKMIDRLAETAKKGGNAKK